MLFTPFRAHQFGRILRVPAFIPVAFATLALWSGVPGGIEAEEPKAAVGQTVQPAGPQPDPLVQIGHNASMEGATGLLPNAGHAEPVTSFDGDEAAFDGFNFTP